MNLRLNKLTSRLLLVFLLTAPLQNSLAHIDTLDKSEAATLSRIKKIGEVSARKKATLDSANSDLPIGERIYTNFCSACHNTGVAGAPHVHNVTEWQPRLTKGIDAAIKSVIEGLGAMPPMGMCNSCTNEELAAAIEFMSKDKK